MRAHPLDVAKRVQELAAELDRLLLAGAGPRDVRVAEQLHLAAVAVGERLVGGGQGHGAVAADGADPRGVDLERVVVGEVAQPVALDLRAKHTVAAEALDDEVGHHVVGLVARCAEHARRVGRGRIAHQPPGSRSEHGHHQQRQVGRDEVEQAPRPGRRSDRLGAGEAEIDLVVFEAGGLRPGTERHRVPSRANCGPFRSPA